MFTKYKYNYNHTTFPPQKKNLPIHRYFFCNPSALSVFSWGAPPFISFQNRCIPRVQRSEGFFGSCHVKAEDRCTTHFSTAGDILFVDWARWLRMKTWLVGKMMGQKRNIGTVKIDPPPPKKNRKGNNMIF